MTTIQNHLKEPAIHFINCKFSDSSVFEMMWNDWDDEMDNKWDEETQSNI